MAGCGAALTGVGRGAVEVGGAHFSLVAFASNCRCGQSCCWASYGRMGYFFYVCTSCAMLFRI